MTIKNVQLISEIGLIHLNLFMVDFQIKSQEITGIMKDFDEPGTLAPTGLHLAGVKYMVIQGEPGAVIRGKKVYYYSILHTTFYSSYQHYTRSL